MRRLARVAAGLVATATLVGWLPSCGAQDGVGSVTGTLDVPECWTGPFNLAPDFFAAMPYRNTLQVRMQRGSDFETFADGLAILFADTSKIRPDAAGKNRYEQDLPVSLPPAVTPPGIPIQRTPADVPIHMTVYLQRICRTRNVTLYALDKVLLNADGSCGERPGDPLDCSPNALARPTGASTMRVKRLPSGSFADSNAEDRLIEGSFDVYLGDPREGCGGGAQPPPCRGHLIGDYRFYYDRSKPAQPFP
jgi:hypothetical protein